MWREDTKPCCKTTAFLSLSHRVSFPGRGHHHEHHGRGLQHEAHSVMAHLCTEEATDMSLQFGLYPYCGNCYSLLRLLAICVAIYRSWRVFCTSNLLLVGGRWPAPYSQFARWTWFWCNWSIGV